MTWTAPVTHSVGDFIDASDWNNEISNNHGLIVSTAYTTVGGLAAAWSASTPPDGAFGRLRLGASPYSFVDIRYDATYAKWVSASQVFPMTGGANDTGYGSGTLREFANVGRPNTAVPWAVMDTAGLKPELRCVGEVVSGATGGFTSSFFYPGFRTANVGSSSWTSDTHFTGGAGTTVTTQDTSGATWKIQDTGWVTIDAGYTATDFISPTTVYAKVTGTGTMNFRFVSGNMLLRWTS